MRNKIMINLLRINAYLMREGNKIASKYKINQQQFVVLNYILHNQPVNQNQICSSLLFEKSNISKIIKKLETLKYIDVNKSLSDRRSTIIECSKKGKEIVKIALQEFNDFNNQFLNGLTDEQVNNALDVTEVINSSIKNNS